jgi:hypothetical protein
MKEFISKNSNGKTVLIFAIITGIVYLIMPFVTMPKVIQFTNGMNILDLMPGGYDFEYANTLFRTLGEEGRHNYLFYQIPVDMVFPLLFAITNCLLIALFLKKLKRFKTPFIYLCFLPFIGGAADYGENIGIILMLNQFPDITGLAVKITSFFSIVKYSAIAISFFVIIALGIMKAKVQNH